MEQVIIYVCSLVATLCATAPKGAADKHTAHHAEDTDHVGESDGDDDGRLAVQCPACLASCEFLCIFQVGAHVSAATGSDR